MELQILQVLWELGACTVRQIHNELTRDRDGLYASTVKMMGVMHEKGFVSKDDSIRPLTYKAAVTRRKTQGRLVDDLIQKAFNGSAGSLVLQALAGKRADAEELKAIREMLDRIEGDQS